MRHAKFIQAIKWKIGKGQLPFFHLISPEIIPKIGEGDLGDPKPNTKEKTDNVLAGE